MTNNEPLIINLQDAPKETQMTGDHWGATWKVMTPEMRERGGSLGMVWQILPPGRAACPFHTHQREDEVFFVLSGTGVFRYGEHVRTIREGDCISCPAGTGIAHQIANNSDRDLVYLAIGPHDPDEVATFPDSGKVFVRSLQRVGTFENTDYMHGEVDRPAILDLEPTAE